MTTRILLVFGTRPEAIKMAPLIKECQQHPESIDPIVCVTGQHREMLTQVLDYFEITPDVHLDVMQPNQTLAGLTSRCLTRLDEVITSHEPAAIVAQGDTTTVMTAAMAAFYRRLPFVHIEAGLRTGDINAPWPEEFNRRVAGLVTTLHCAPTQRSAENLLNEGVPASQVHVTGNTVIDSLLWTVERERANSELWQRKYNFLGEREMVLITGHRRENFGSGFEDICTAISQLADLFPEVAFLYPVHLNPQVQQPVHRLLGRLPNVYLTAPAPYPEFVWLMDRAKVILTDSGGVQEEAPSLKKPILVMRDTTERPEALDAGAVELVGTNADAITLSVTNLLSNRLEYERRIIKENPYGDGKASERIVKLLLESVCRVPSRN